MNKSDINKGLDKKGNPAGIDNIIKLCFVNTTKSWGGGERWHFENAVYASQQGFKVSIICSKNSSLHDKTLKAGIHCHPVNITNLSFINPFSLRNLKQYFRKNGIDAVVFNGPSDLKTAGIAAMRAGVSLRIYRRGLAKAPHRNILNRFLFSNVVTDYIVNSKATAKALFSRSKPSQQETAHVHVLYNGIEPHPNIKNPFSDQNKIVFGNASRFVPQKGLHYLLDMAFILKKSRTDFVVRIAGTGPLEKALKEKASALDVHDVVEFTGFVDDVPAFMSGIDVYVCTSIFEGFGFSIAEAMHAGKPIIGFDVSSNPELVSDQKTGYLVPAFDVRQLTNKALVLMENKELRRKFGNEGQRVALEKFNKIHQHEKFCELMIRLFGRAGLVSSE
ncbi:MAG: glycosyltransferase [Bacteroidota bacterium]|nr:glycosyltransferase [Bacteroidota bacterium]